MKCAATKLFHVPLTFVAAFFLCLVACGKPDHRDSATAIQKNLQSSPMSSSNGSEQVSEFSLFENMLNFDLEVSGCASGYSAMFTRSTLTQIKLFKNDYGCLAKLQRFSTVDGTQYAPKANAGFINFLVGDSAIFENSSRTKTVKVSIIAQLSSPIAPTDTIDYKFSSVSQDPEAKEILKPTWDLTGINIKNPATVPKVSLRQAVLVELVTSSRKGVFDIYVECETLMVAGKCQGVSAADMKFDINVDVGNDCSVTSPNLCETATIKERGATLVNPGDALLPLGGFIFTGIDTPVALAGAKNLVFVLSREADNSVKPAIKESIRAWNFDIELGAKFELAEVADLGIALLEGR